MNHEARRRQLLRELKRVGWCWCILVGIVGTIGGISGLVERENDDA